MNCSRHWIEKRGRKKDITLAMEWSNDLNKHIYLPDSSNQSIKDISMCHFNEKLWQWIHDADTYSNTNSNELQKDDLFGESRSHCQWWLWRRCSTGLRFTMALGQIRCLQVDSENFIKQKPWTFEARPQNLGSMLMRGFEKKPNSERFKAVVLLAPR